MLPDAGFLPHANSSQKCIGVVADTATRRQLFQFLHVAAAKHYFVRFDGSNQALHHVSDITPPFFLPMLLEATNPNIVLEGGLFVRQVSQLHRLDDAIHNQGGPKPGSQSQEEHLPELVTSQSLHGGIVQELDGTFECGFEVETDPPLSQIPRFRNGPVPQDWPGVPYGYGIVLPVRREFSNLGHHSFWRQRRPGIKLSMSILSRGQDLDVSSADINHQYVHDALQSATWRVSFHNRITGWARLVS